MEIHPQHPENFRLSREYFQEIHEWYKEESTNSTTEYEYCRSKDSNPGVSSGELVPTPLAHQSLRGVLGTGHTYCEILQPIYEKFFFSYVVCKYLSTNPKTSRALSLPCMPPLLILLCFDALPDVRALLLALFELYACSCYAHALFARIA